MNPLLDAKLRDVDIKCSIQHADYLRLTHDRAITLSQIVDQDTEEEVNGLLLSELCRILLTEGGKDQIAGLDTRHSG